MSELKRVKDLNVIEKFEDDILTQFNINGIKVKHLKRFKAVAEECNNSYAMALVKLLDSHEADWKFKLLLERVEALESAEPEPAKPKKLPTFENRGK
jgi:hypothetical protein